MTGYRLRTEIGGLLRLRRQAAGLSQDMLARHADVTQSVISRIERGLTATSLDLVERLFSALDLQLRIGAERLDAHVDAEIARLSARSPAERLESWDWTLEHLRSFDVVFEGAIAGLLQGVPLPVDAADVVITTGDLDRFATWLDRRGALRWSDRWQEFRNINSDPREPGALHWHMGMGDVRARICRELPESVSVAYGEATYRVRPLTDVELTDPSLAALLRRYREVASTGREGRTERG